MSVGQGAIRVNPDAPPVDTILVPACPILPENRRTLFGMPTDHDAREISAGLQREVHGMEPCRIRVGGSVPILPMFLDALDVRATGTASGFP
jgi:hypothetical protein